MLQRQLLIIASDLEIIRPIRERLGNSTMKADYATSLSKALEYVIKRPYCLLIVDLQMSAIDHAELVRIFRVAKRTPILALTEALTAQEKIDLFHAGVDAFLEKPTDADVCAAQANALIELYLESDKDVGKSVPITFGTALVIAPRYRQVLVGNKPLDLTRREFDLLYFFARHPGQVFSRDHIYDCVWGDYFELGGDATVKVHIKTLRKKLSDLNAGIIENIRGVGYRFVPPKEE
ncbi:MAG: response regulator transcription factor [Oscillospiraceae bacterium]